MSNATDLIARILAQVDNIATAVASLSATNQAQSVQISDLQTQLAALEPQLTDIDTKMTALAGTLTPKVA